MSNVVRHVPGLEGTADKYDRFVIETKAKASRVDRFGPVKEARRAMAEIFGTMVLTMTFALGPVVQTATGGLLPTAAIVLAPGLVLAALIIAMGQISGGHFNPVVTIAFWLRGVFATWRVPMYILCQGAGAVIAAALILAVYGNIAFLGSTVPGPGISHAEAVFFEIIFTFIFLTVILNVAEQARIVGASAGLAIGLTLLALTVIGAFVTGPSVNPARSFGPAVISGGHAIDVYWIYIVGPVIGMLMAVIFGYMLMLVPYERVGPTGLGRTADPPAPADQSGDRPQAVV